MTLDRIISLQQVSIYQQHNLVLSNISFHISKGEMVYLLGKTGSGKSSLLKTLYSDLPLAEGEASIAGFNLASIRRKEISLLRRKLGIVFQDFQLLTDRSVQENLLFVLKATGWAKKQDMVWLPRHIKCRMNYQEVNSSALPLPVHF
jgi:cell division transport system ATP-binding protein